MKVILNSISRSLCQFTRWICVGKTKAFLFLVLLFLALAGCEENQIQKVEVLDHDPYRDWELGIAVDGRYRKVLERELTLLPPGRTYELQATPRLRDGQSASTLFKVEDDESKIFIFENSRNLNLAEKFFESDRAGILNPINVSFKAPSQGGGYIAALEIEQTVSQYNLSQSRGNDRPEKTVQVQLQKTAHVLLPTISAEHFTKDGFVSGYEVGVYPQPKKSDKPFVRQNPQYYQVPDFFYRVDRESAGMKISEHFQLGQFDLDFEFLPGEFPQYIALDDRLIRKLELLIDRMNADGYEIETFNILAGFRSPKFNLGYKQEDEDFSLSETYSQHMYGRAVDLIVDRDGDGRMDDLDGNGRVTIDDARVILAYVDQIDKEALEGLNDLIGGAGVYYRHDIPDRQVQTPYIHIDVRGFVNAAGRPMR